jgi:hypothetical protein
MIAIWQKITTPMAANNKTGLRLRGLYAVLPNTWALAHSA